MIAVLSALLLNSLQVDITILFSLRVIHEDKYVGKNLEKMAGGLCLDILYFSNFRTQLTMRSAERAGKK